MYGAPAYGSPAYGAVGAASGAAWPEPAGTVPAPGSGEGAGVFEGVVTP